MKLTPEELIAMAHEAGASIERWMTNSPKVAGVHMSPEQLEVFASLVSARTREECASLVEAIEAKCVIDDVDSPELPDVAAAIRAMGERA